MMIQNIILVSLVLIGMVAAWQSSDYPGDVSQTLYNVTAIPFKFKNPGLYTKIIVIGGIPLANPSDVHHWLFSLENGNSSISALYCDIRFKFYGQTNTIVRNTWITGFGIEEKTTPNFPFKVDQYFEVRIVIEPDRFKVAVNNIHLFDYAKRLVKMSDIETLSIAGDVRLTYVRFQ